MMIYPGGPMMKGVLLDGGDCVMIYPGGPMMKGVLLDGGDCDWLADFYKSVAWGYGDLLVDFGYSEKLGVLVYGVDWGWLAKYVRGFGRLSPQKTGQWNAGLDITGAMFGARPGPWCW